MKTFFKLSISSVLLLISITFDSIAQELYMSDVSGTALRKDSKYAEVEGTPFLQEDWKDGSVTFTSNKTVKSIPLKYNIESGELYFKNQQSGSEMLFADPVASFTIDGRNFRSGFNPIETNSAKTFYEVLSAGKVYLLKKTNKTIMAVTEYNAPNRRVFKENFNYYIVNENKEIVKVKKDNSIFGLFKDKEDAVKSFASKNKISVKKDDDLTKLFNYYNSL